MASVLEVLQDEGFKISPHKAQLGKPTVQYPGYTISQGKKDMSDDRCSAISSMPRPVNVRGVRKVMRLFNYCRNFMPGFSALVAPIQTLIKGWEPPLEAVEEKAFTNIKKALVSAPPLGLPDAARPFHLYCSNEGGYYNAVVVQDHEGSGRLEAYYSTKQDPVALQL
ncbi:uncharacterized protein [Mobula birostris]|uniref:uncharacterized protein n=1 Tax=Mobula birostris TaxID=1983395 RepID=UPI003B28431A